MCHNAIFPTTMSAAQSGSEVNELIYTFNRWLKMLQSYGKLDPQVLTRDLTAMSKAIRGKSLRPDVKRAVRACRDYALAKVIRPERLSGLLISTLEILCKTQESKEIKKVADAYADQGMTERYRPLSRRLAREKIRKIDRFVTFTDRNTDDNDTTRLVRRFVEKRAAQAVHHNSGRHDRETNRFRQSVRRATSFSLYNTRYADYDAQLRARGTHWKVVHHDISGDKVLVAKHCYSTFEDAQAAALRHSLNNPKDPRPLTPYKCDHCGKWHIGHDRLPALPQPSSPAETDLPDGKIPA